MSITLYPGIPFSPQATLTNNIGAADTIIQVSDVSAFPDAPNLATIGTDEEGETVLYTAKTDTALSGCQRGVEGTAKSWQAGEPIGRNFTAKDHNDLIALMREVVDSAKLLTATIPKGRMRGDVDGDGRITELDADMTQNYNAQILTLNDIELWCSDANGDGKYNLRDVVVIRQYLEGQKNEFDNWLDYYGNWTYVSVEGQRGYWTTDISIPGLTTEMSAVVNISGEWLPDMFGKAEIISGAIRISSARPPITEASCIVIYGKGNSSTIVCANRCLTVDDVGAES